MAKKKNSGARPLPMAARLQLHEAEELYDADRFEQAHSVLRALDAQYPRRVEILELLAYVCAGTQDYRALQSAARALIEVAPRFEADWLGTLGQAYMFNAHPALAVATLDDYLARFPDHELASPLREQMPAMRQTATEMIDQLPFPTDRKWELARLHDQLNVQLENHQMEAAQQTARELLAEVPRFAPALNNLSQAQWISGQPGEAIETSKRILEFAPDNVHALSNLARYCFRCGRVDEARDYAAQLKESRAPGSNLHFKKAEAWAYVGDFDAILDAYGQAKKSEDWAFTEADFKHLAAVALARAGREKEARQLWDDILAGPPPMLAQCARENRVQLDAPASERCAPWPFPLEQWFEGEEIARMHARTEAVARAGTGTGTNSEAAQARELARLQSAMRDFVAENAGMETRLSAQFERGDAAGLELAVMMLDLAGTPDLVEAARTFALGQIGPEQQRVRVAQLLMQQGVLPSGSTRMWIEGEWTELLLMGFEITTNRPPRCRRASNASPGKSAN